MLNVNKEKTPNSLVELFEQPGTWCQDQYCINSNGITTYEIESIVKCCLSGGIFITYGNAGLPIPREVTRKLKEAIGLPPEGSVVQWNDRGGRTQQEVLEVCRKAGV